MHTDELRAELAELADEVESFSGDIGAVRRRVNNRRVTTGVVAGVVTLAMLTGIATLVRSRSNEVTVAHSAKSVAPDQLPRLDAVVVMPAGATADEISQLQTVLDDTAGVQRYASLPVGSLASVLASEHDADASRLHTQVCADPSIRSFAITLARAVPDADQQLTAATRTHATVLPIRHVSDIEVFMSLTAPQAAVAAIRDVVAIDPDVVKHTFVDHHAAFEEFKRLFADQPLLIENETPAGLPESFRVDVRDGASITSVAARYQDLPGVKQVITRSTDLLLGPDRGFTHACSPTRP